MSSSTSESTSSFKSLSSLSDLFENIVINASEQEVLVDECPNKKIASIIRKESNNILKNEETLEKSILIKFVTEKSDNSNNSEEKISPDENLEKNNNNQNENLQSNGIKMTELETVFENRLESIIDVEKPIAIKRPNLLLRKNSDHIAHHQRSDSEHFYSQNEKSLIVGDEENQNHSGDKLSQTKISLTNSLTDVNEDLINEKNNEIGRVTKWAVGFEKLLEDPLGLQIFTNFLKKEFSNENIDFWVKCENFKKISDPREMITIANEIWSEYLDTSSMTQINVDSKARSHCKEALLEPNSAMFEKAQTHIFNLMRYDSYSRFLKSQMYKDCIVNEMSGKPLIQTDSKTNHKMNMPNGSSSKDAISNKNSNSSQNNDQQKMPIDIGNENDNLNIYIPNASANLAAAVQMAASTGTAVLNQINSTSPTSPIPISASNFNSHTDQNSPNKKKDKEKKTMSTILPWTKAFIKWKRLSGKGKKNSEIINQNQLLRSPNTLVKSFNHKNSLTGSPITETPSLFFNEKESEIVLNSSLSQQLDSKYCRVLYSNDGSSTIIQTLPGQTVYQILKKIFQKKQIPWYKCDLYYVDEEIVVDQHVDSQLVGSKEICLVERSLFVLSLIPIAINVCVKASMKKPLSFILKPILDSYQIKTSDCAIFLNSTTILLNLADLCSSIDNQNVLVVHKTQANMLGPEELDKYAKLAVEDFIPNTFQDDELQFDDLGVLKQCKPRSQRASIERSNHNSPSINSNSNLSNTTNSCNMKLEENSTISSNEKQGEQIYI